MILSLKSISLHYITLSLQLYILLLSNAFFKCIKSCLTHIRPASAERRMLLNVEYKQVCLDGAKVSMSGLKIGRSPV